MLPRVWKHPRWRRRIFSALTVLLVLSLALHPELRLLAPVLDTLGLDVLMALFGAQLATFLADAIAPFWGAFWRRALPLVLAGARSAGSIPEVRLAWRHANSLLADGSGSVGLYVWVRLAGLSYRLRA